MSKNRFCKIPQSVHKNVKFRYFAKVIKYSKSPDRVLQSYILYVHMFKFEIFSGVFAEHFAKIANLTLMFTHRTHRNLKTR